MASQTVACGCVETTGIASVLDRQARERRGTETERVGPAQVSQSKRPRTPSRADATGK